MKRVFLAKARESLRAATRLAEDGAFEGAANRAYFAMFHAARAALFEFDPQAAATIKSHRSVIGLFGVRLVRSEIVGVHLGRWLNSAEALRAEADYDPALLDDAERVRAVVARAAVFLSEIGPVIGPDLQPGAAP